MIGVWEGRLDLHGKIRSHTWTKLAKTAIKDATEITLQVPASSSDWTVGDEIAIASTSFDYQEAEKRRITKVKASGEEADALLVLELDKALDHGHFAQK